MSSSFFSFFSFFLILQNENYIIGGMKLIHIIICSSNDTVWSSCLKQKRLGFDSLLITLSSVVVIPTYSDFGKKSINLV